MTYHGGKVGVGQTFLWLGTCTPCGFYAYVYYVSSEGEYTGMNGWWGVVCMLGVFQVAGSGTDEYVCIGFKASSRVWCE